MLEMCIISQIGICVLLYNKYNFACEEMSKSLYNRKKLHLAICVGSLLFIKRRTIIEQGKMMERNVRVNAKLGFTNGIATYVMWGLFPLFWTLLAHVNSFDILANRIVWSFVFSVVAMIVLNKWHRFIDVVRQLIESPKKAIILFFASVCISVNWFMYIWAVANHHVIDTSLGYYINPLLSIVFGVIIYKETLLRGQKIAITIAAIGVAIMIVSYGEIPFIALTLAVSFALYGVMKKQVQLEALHSVALETLLILPIALGYMVYQWQQGQAAFLHIHWTTDVLLIVSGLVTIIPLVCFAVAAKNLPLYVLGFLQYMTPTMTLLFGLFLYGETFSQADIIGFSFIWLSLFIFSVATYRQHRRMNKVAS